MEGAALLTGPALATKASYCVSISWAIASSAAAKTPEPPVARALATISSVAAASVTQSIFAPGMTLH